MRKLRGTSRYRYMFLLFQLIIVLNIFFFVLATGVLTEVSLPCPIVNGHSVIMSLDVRMTEPV